MIKERIFSNKKIIFLADIHYGLKSSNRNSNRYIEWMDNMDNYFYNFFIPLVKREAENDNEKPMVMIAGDFFDNRFVLGVDILNRGKEVIKAISNVCPVLMVVGNHDMCTEDDSTKNSLKVFEDMENVHVFEKEEIITVCDKKIDMIPWINNSQEMTKVIKKSESDYIVTHAEINGMMYPSKVSVSNKADAKGYKGSKIIAGHIHKRQEKGKVVYLGSPYELDMSDIGNDKGVYILNLESGQLSFINNDASPKYIVADANDLNGKDSSEIISLIRGNYVTINYNSNDAPKYDALRRMLEESSEAKNIEFNEIRPEINVDVEDNDERELISIDDAVIECIRKMDIAEDDANVIIEKHKQYQKILSNEI